MGLGAYHSGVLETLWHRDIRPDWFAGSSIGAVTCALAAGAPEPLAALRKFWGLDSGFEPPAAGHVARWGSAINARLTGVPGHFRPRLNFPLRPFASLYDLAPMRDRLKGLIDFGRLNNGAARVSVATTDIENGELIIFDTGKGDRIEMDHLLASCGYLPDFAPVEIGGRWLGDGGLCANVPLEAVTMADAPDPLVCFVVDLFARDGDHPGSLETAAARRGDLQFANQTWQRLQAHVRETALGARSGGEPRDQQFFYLSYRPAPEEAGPEKMFDYSLTSTSQRWQAGAADAALALTKLQRAAPIGVGVEIIRRG
jgi:NTE family protein